MLTAAIYLIIYFLIIVLVVYLILHVLAVVGVALPPKVIQIIWLIVGLVALLMLVNFLLGGGVVSRALL